MSVKSDKWIIDTAQRHELIKPFSAEQVRNGISYGVSAYGYDISLSDEFKVFCPDRVTEIDPKNKSETFFDDVTAESVLVPPNSYILARTREYFKIPRDILVICFGKSTYARCGLVVNITPFEPEWEGFATVSLSNTTPRPIRVYANEGIAQIIFMEASEVCDISYKDKKGKYQGQTKITLSKSG